MTKKLFNSTKILYSLVAIIAFSIALYAPIASAQVAGLSRDFNHMSTGFPLTGVHTTVTCETCHVGGVFKGTPRDCAGCHSIGRRVVATFKSPNHMVTTAACETCHTNTISFIGARFNHIGVQPKACMTCHSGPTAPSKPGGHIVTNLSCDSCHRTSGWLPAGFDHVGALPACDSCHNGTNAKGKPVNHIPTTAACDSCHKSGFSTFLGALYDHATVLPMQCGSCHIPGTYNAKTKTSGHIPYTGNDCDSCHVGTGYITFAGSTMNHNLPLVKAMTCITCHNGSYTSQGTFLGGAKAKTNTTIHNNTTASCDTCHPSFNTFLGGSYTHVTATVAGQCRTCHNGAQALGPTSSVTHTTAPGNTASCETCHTNNASNYTTFANNAVFTHTAAVANICGTCHLGQTASVVTKGQFHIPTTGNACDSCHSSGNFSTGAFTIATMKHSSPSIVGVACTTCHSGAYISEKGTAPGLGAQIKIGGHVTTTAECSLCHHDSTYMSFAGGIMDHSGVTPTTCGKGGCHSSPNASGAKVKNPATHIPTVSDACDACHTSGYAIGAFNLAQMNHAAVTSVPGGCAACHSGAYTSQGTQGALAKPINHMTTSDPCSNCHLNYTSFLGAIFPHTGVLPGACGTCHITGSTVPGSTDALKLPLGNAHIPTNAGNACDICHTSGYAVGAYKKATMNHSVVSNTCTDCHDGVKFQAGYGNLGGPYWTGSKNIHIPITTQVCTSCHVGTTSWAHPPEVMNHVANSNISNCKLCHGGSKSAYIGSMQTRTIGSHECSSTAKQTDCTSGCHKLQYTNWKNPSGC